MAAANSGTPPSPRRKFARGFSLVELAIVLGVGGVILGGIWVAANSAIENARRQQFGEDLIVAVKNIRALYTGQAGISGDFTKTYPDAKGVANGATLTGHLAIIGAIPGDMIRNRSAFTAGGEMYVDGPWGAAGVIPTQGSLAVCATSSATGLSCTNATTQFFAVEARGLSLDSCIAVAIAGSGSAAPPGVTDVVINGTSIMTGAGVTHALPPLATDASTLCQKAAPATVDFVYRLRPPGS